MSYIELSIKIIALLIFICVLPRTTWAGEPKCGEVDKEIIEETYESAERVRHYYDKRYVLEDICAVMEAFEDWESALSSAQHKTVENDIEQHIDGVTQNITELKRPLTVMRVWLRADVSGSLQRAKRKAHILSAEKDVNHISGKLKRASQAIRTLMAKNLD